MELVKCGNCREELGKDSMAFCKACEEYYCQDCYGAISFMMGASYCRGCVEDFERR